MVKREIRKRIFFGLIGFVFLASAFAITKNPDLNITTDTTQEVPLVLSAFTKNNKPSLLNTISWSVVSGSATITVATDSLSGYLVSTDFPSDSIIQIKADSFLQNINFHVVFDTAAFDGKRVRDIINTNIKPLVAKPGAGYFGRLSQCLNVWSVYTSSIVPIEKPYDKALNQMFKSQCSTCPFSVFLSSNGC